MTLIARDLMTPHVKSVPENWTVQRFAAFLSENQITGSPVINAAGEIVGIATLSDIADFHLKPLQGSTSELLSEEEQKEARHLRQLIFNEMSRTPVEVRDIMTPMLVSVDESCTPREVARIMMDEHIHRVFVKRGAEIVGILTTYDLLRLLVDA